MYKDRPWLASREGRSREGRSREGRSKIIYVSQDHQLSSGARLALVSNKNHYPLYIRLPPVSKVREGHVVEIKDISTGRRHAHVIITTDDTLETGSTQAATASDIKEHGTFIINSNGGAVRLVLITAEDKRYWAILSSHAGELHGETCQITSREYPFRTHI